MGNILVKQLFDIDNCDVVSTKDEEIDGRTVKTFHLRYDGEKPERCPKCGGKLYKHGDREIKALDTPIGGCPVV